MSHILPFTNAGTVPVCLERTPTNRGRHQYGDVHFPEKMAEQSKEADSKTVGEALTEVLSSEKDKNEVTEDGSQVDADDAPAAEGIAKKKKSKKAKLKKALGRTSSAEDGPSANAEGPSAGANPASKLTSDMVQQLLEMNPSLKSEVAGMSQEQTAQKIKSLEVADLITGMVGL